MICLCSLFTSNTAVRELGFTRPFSEPSLTPTHLSGSTSNNCLQVEPQFPQLRRTYQLSGHEEPAKEPRSSQRLDVVCVCGLVVGFGGQGRGGRHFRGRCPKNAEKWSGRDLARLRARQTGTRMREGGKHGARSWRRSGFENFAPQSGEQKRFRNTVLSLKMTGLFQ